MLENNGKNVEKNIDEFWQHTRDDLVIAHINDKVGMGVFLSPHANPIKKGDIVTLYSGEYDSSPDDQLFHEYSFFLPAHPIFSDPATASQNKIVKGQINATNCGNLARFIQDLPTKTELEKHYVLPKELISSIATANLDPITAAYQRYPIVYFTANRDIQPGEQLGFSYSTGFWSKAKYLRNIKRALFDHKGQVVDDSPYVNYLDLHFKIDGINHYHCFELFKLKFGILCEQTAAFLSSATMSYVIIQWQRLMITCAKALCDIDISHNIYFKALFDIAHAKMKSLNPSSSYQVIFCSKVRLALMAHSVKQELHSDQFSQQKINYIKKAMNYIHSSADDADQMFKKIAEMLKDPNYASYFKEHLAELRSELIRLMNQYNQDKSKLSQITNETVISLKK